MNLPNPCAHMVWTDHMVKNLPSLEGRGGYHYTFIQLLMSTAEKGVDCKEVSQPLVDSMWSLQLCSFQHNPIFLQGGRLMSGTRYSTNYPFNWNLAKYIECKKWDALQERWVSGRDSEGAADRISETTSSSSKAASKFHQDEAFSLQEKSFIQNLFKQSLFW